MKIKSLQFCSLLSLLMCSSYLGIIVPSAIKIAKIDCYLVPVIGSILGLPLLFIYLYIFNAKKNMNINRLNNYLFKNKLGKIINIIILLEVLTFNMITFFNLTTFVESQFLYNTPGLFITILFMFVIFYIFNKKDTTIFRATLILFYIVILLFVISFIGLILKSDINNIKPILENGIGKVISASFNYTFYMVMPIYFTLIIPREKIDSNNLNKKIIKTYFLTNIVLFIILYLIISVFGIEIASLYEYPTYHILKRVFIGGFIERMENVLSIAWIITLIIPCAFTYFYSYNSIKEIFNIKKTFINIFLLTIMFLSQFIFKNNTTSYYFLRNTYPTIIGISIILILILIALKIKKIHKVS